MVKRPYKNIGFTLNLQFQNLKGRLKQRPQPIRKRTGTPKMAIYQSGVIFDQVDTANPDCWTLDEYVKRGGYSALRRILSENISQPRRD